MPTMTMKLKSEKELFFPFKLPVFKFCTYKCTLDSSRFHLVPAPSIISSKRLRAFTVDLFPTVSILVSTLRRHRQL